MVSVSENSEKIRTWPDSVLVIDEAVRKFRGIAAELGMNRDRMYGMAIEFAVENEGEFSEFVDERE